MVNWRAMAAGYKMGSDIADRRRDNQQREAFENYTQLMSQDVGGMDYTDFNSWEKNMRQLMPGLSRDDAYNAATLLHSGRKQQRANTLSTMQKLYELGDVAGAVDFFNARSDVFSAKNKIILRKLADGMSAEEITPEGAVRSARFVPNSQISDMIMSLRHGLEGGAKQEATQRRAEEDTASKIGKREFDKEQAERRTRATEMSAGASASRNIAGKAHDAARAARQAENHIVGLREAGQKELRAAYDRAQSASDGLRTEILKLEDTLGDDVIALTKEIAPLAAMGAMDEVDKVAAALTQGFDSARARQTMILVDLHKRKASLENRTNQLRDKATTPIKMSEAIDTGTGVQGAGRLTPGVVVDGYKFSGGDPNDQSNWQQVQ